LNYLYQHVESFICDTAIGLINYRKFSFGSIREDTILKKVYYRDITGDSDKVLMDYNLNVGDTFFVDHSNDYGVTAIDSTLINSTWHKVWHFANNIDRQPCEVIEGVGCLEGPIYMLGHELDYEPLVFQYYMYCFSNRGITPAVYPPVLFGYSYPQDSFNNETSCWYFPGYYTYTNQLQPGQAKITVYPNPTTSILTISASETITSISINNLVGQTLCDNHYNSTQVQVNVANLPSAIYFVKVNGTEVRTFLKE